MDAKAAGLSLDSAPAEAPVLAGPVAQRDRISSLDVLRGFALLGILVMNISDYALPGNFDFNPTILGPLSKLNLFLWMGRFVLFEGKMRALFSLLFGAGVILLTSRLEKRGEAAIAGDIFTRRNMWLALFGVLHAYFLWWGDILYFYGMTALLFLFPCRHLKAGTLLIAGVGCVLGGVGYRSGRLESPTQLAQRAEAATRAQAAKQTLTDQQREDIQDWEKVLKRSHPSREELDKETAELRGGYASVFSHNAEQVI